MYYYKVYLLLVCIINNAEIAILIAILFMNNYALVIIIHILIYITYNYKNVSV